MIKLRCVGNYANTVRGLVFAAGDVFEVTEEQHKFLMADAPLCFEQVKAVEAAPNKAIKNPPQDKGL